MTRALLALGTVVLSLCREIGGMALLGCYTLFELIRGRCESWYATSTRWAWCRCRLCR